MPRTCTICRHKHRAEIEKAVVAGTPLRAIGIRWGASRPAIARHTATCVNDTISEAVADRETGHTERLIDQVRSLQTRTVALIDQVEGVLRAAKRAPAKLSAVNVAARVIREIRGNMELLGRLTGELDSGNKITVNVLTNPQWIELRGAVIAALAPHPEALQAVLATIERLGSGERSSA